MIDCPELFKRIHFKVNSINSMNKITFYLSNININTKYNLCCIAPANILTNTIL